MDEEVQIIGTKSLVCNDSKSRNRSVSTSQVAEETMDDVEIVESSWVISDDETDVNEYNDTGLTQILDGVTKNASEMSVISSGGSDDVQIMESSWSNDNDDLEIIKEGCSTHVDNLDMITKNTFNLDVTPSPDSERIQIVESRWVIDDNDDEIIKEELEDSHPNQTDGKIAESTSSVNPQNDTDRIETVESRWTIDDGGDCEVRKKEYNNSGEIQNKEYEPRSEFTIKEEEEDQDQEHMDSEMPQIEINFPDNFSSTEVRKERYERKVVSGMAALLQQLRQQEKTEKSNCVDQSSRSCAKNNFPSIKMNRKERRAMLQKQAMHNAEEVMTSEEPICPKKERLHVELDFNRAPSTPTFIESLCFRSGAPDFGFSTSVTCNNYVKSCKFSPCGRYLATTSQDRKARIFGVNHDASELTILSSMQLGDIPYDAIWHPCGELLATSSKHHPIHMWNTQGVREASYRGINHLDELSAAYTMAFSADGLRMYGGYEKYIRTWDVRRPGRQLMDIKTWSKGSGGQKAIISSIAVHPIFDGVYAAGCYGPSIALYSDRTNSIDCLFTGDFTATTCIKYSKDGLRLYSAGRKDNTIYCWDMRNPGKLLYTLHREMMNNQKTYFDINSDDTFLLSGTSDGQIVAFNLCDDKQMKSPIYNRKATRSAVPCVSIHPSLPVVAMCSGERIYPFPMLSGSEEVNEDEGKNSYLGVSDEGELENTVQLWHL